MEPMNCTADVRSDRCEVWVPTQFPEVVRDKAAEITGLEPEQVTVHTLPGWRLWPSRLGLRSTGNSGLQGRWSSGQADLDQRGRHPARFLSPSLQEPLTGSLDEDGLPSPGATNWQGHQRFRSSLGNLWIPEPSANC